MGGTFADQVKFFAMEGSSLTLFGLLKYNLDDDKFEMTELTGIFAGGL